MNFQYHNVGFQEDRNKKMITVLSQKNSEGKETAKGVFLFALYGNNEPICITPPGLTDDEAVEMCNKFFALFGEYAKKAEARKKRV